MSHATMDIGPVAKGFLWGVACIAYSVLSYLVGVAGLGVLILATLEIVPLGWFRLAGSSMSAVLVDIGLLLLFGAQHSLMARPGFKRLLGRILPPALERSTYVWTSGIALAMIVAFWQPIGGSLWRAQGVLHWILLAVGLTGWAYLFAATFAINHWDLFGLRQSWFAAKNRTYEQVPFKEHWMYRYSRHPIMLGVLLGIWMIPAMSVSQCLLSSGLTLYGIIGVYFEERDLIRQWGQGYLNYRRRVGALFTLPSRGGN